MKIRFTLCCLLLAAGALIAAAGFSPTAPAPTPAPAASCKVVLVPLDSRPACLKLVVDLGRIANIEVVTPPRELLDHYQAPANRAALRAWLYENSQGAAAAILSIDMLVHGGLLASRQPADQTADMQDTLALLARLHRDYPYLKMYAFHIIPRLLPADNARTSRYQRDVLQYSVLKEETQWFENPADLAELTALEKKIPAEILARYQFLYAQNTLHNLQLIDLAKQKVLAKLVIGQDDGEAFGMPNIDRQKLLQVLRRLGGQAANVAVTRGADEIAHSLLAEIVARRAKYRPKIYVQYNDAAAPSIIMPYMSHSVATTVAEKIALIDGEMVQNPQSADWILFVHIGANKNMPTLSAAARTIHTLLAQNKPLAVIDLSQNFLADETVFPLLLANGAPINRLLAYAGWNTASNAIGAGLAQAAIFDATRRRAGDGDALLHAYQANVTFLTARFLDDWYYLKVVQPAINAGMRRSGVNVYALQDHYEAALAVLRRSMREKTQALSRSRAYRRPVPIPLSGRTKYLSVVGLKANPFFPWQRTFEISITPKLQFTIADDE